MAAGACQAASLDDWVCTVCRQAGTGGWDSELGQDCWVIGELS